MDRALHLATDIVRRIGGARTKVRRVSGGRVNDVFCASDAANRPVLALRLWRHLAYPSLDALLHVDHCLESLSVAHAKVIAHGRQSVDLPFGWIALEWVGGLRSDIALKRRRTSRAELANLFGATFAVLHSHRYDFFGTLPHGSQYTSRDYLLHTLTDSPVPQLLSARARRELATIQEKVLRLPPQDSALTHGDFTLRNAIWSRGRVTLIDWDNAAAAPAARDAKRVARVLGPHAEAVFAASYGRQDGNRFDAAVHEVLLLSDRLRAACANQSIARDRYCAERQVTRTIRVLEASGV